MNSLNYPEYFWHEAPFCFIASSDIMPTGLYPNQNFLKDEVIGDFKLSLPCWEEVPKVFKAFPYQGKYYQPHPLSVLSHINHSKSPNVFLRGTQLVAMCDMLSSTELLLDFEFVRDI